jgi:hypothetical protein
MHLRPILLALSLAALSGSAGAAPPTASAQLFAERTALLTGDEKCHLLSPDARAALQATTIQARYAALRDAWTAEALAGVAARARTAGAGRACTDGALIAAAKSAAAGYQGWAGLPAMTFQGGTRAWAARRAPDLSGWLLVQNLAPDTQFGVLGPEDRRRVALALPGAAKASSVTLYLRDRARAPKPLFDVPGLAPQPGLAGKAAPRSLAAAYLANARLTDQNDAARQIFVFPAALMDAIAALDPRESVEVEIAPASGGAHTRLYIEVGDLAVARAFLAARKS